MPTDSDEAFLQVSAVGIVEHGKLVRIWGSCRDITERKRYTDRLEFQANHDSLTQLPNRHYLYYYLNHVIDNNHGESKFALLLMDLDKQIDDDTLGHHAGDDLLKLIGPRMERELADIEGLEDNLLVRLGGMNLLSSCPACAIISRLSL